MKEATSLQSEMHSRLFMLFMPYLTSGLEAALPDERVFPLRGWAICAALPGGRIDITDAFNNQIDTEYQQKQAEKLREEASSNSSRACLFA